MTDFKIEMSRINDANSSIEISDVGGLSAISGFTTSNNSNLSENMKLRKKIDFLNFLETKLDLDLGFYFWKRYVSSAFWSNISTPINLVITLLTGVTTAQATNTNLLSGNMSQVISITTLIITVLNTFFRPHEQYNQNTDLMKKWFALGNDFEEIYYTEDKYSTNLEETIRKYKELQTKLNDLKDEGMNSINFLTDLIHTIAQKTCLKKYEKWLDTNKEILKQSGVKLR